MPSEPLRPADTDGPEVFEAHAAWVEQKNAVAVARAIQDAPRDGSWLLGHVPDREAYDEQWCMIAWGDKGWHDSEGHCVAPDLFALLPDPQPKHTGWAPAAGTIRIVELSPDGWTVNGKPSPALWHWMVDIERPDGTHDTYRDCDMRKTRDEAERRALKWQEQFGLPIVTIPLGGKVIPFRPAVTRQ